MKTVEHDGIDNSRRFGASLLRPIASAALLAAVTLTLACGGPKSEEEYLQEAKQTMEQQNLLKAILLYQEYLEQYPEGENVMAARLGLAEAYFRNGEFGEFRDVMRTIMTSAGGPASPQGFGAFRGILDSYREEGKFQEGLDEVMETSATLTQAPGAVMTRLAIEAGIFNELLGQPEEAIAQYHGVLKQIPETPQEEMQHLDILNKLAMFHESEGNLDAALAMFEDYVATHPDGQILPQVHRDMGRVYQALGQDEEADEHFDVAENTLREELAETEEDSTRVLLTLGIAEIQAVRGNLDEAQELYREVIDNYPQDPNRAFALLQLATSMFRENDVETALGLLQQVATEYPDTQFGMQARQYMQQVQEARLRGQAGATTGTVTAPPTPADLATTDVLTTDMITGPGVPSETVQDEEVGTTESAELTEPRESGIPGEAAFGSGAPEAEPAQAEAPESEPAAEAGETTEPAAAETEMDEPAEADGEADAEAAAGAQDEVAPAETEAPPAETEAPPAETEAPTAETEAPTAETEAQDAAAAEDEATTPAASN